MKYGAYDREAAVNYARRWAFSRNPAYANFDEMGGDCSNFVSQCLLAGTRIMNHTPVSGWYYYSLNDRSASWTGVEYLYRFLTNNRGAGPFAARISRQALRPGDVIQLGRNDGSFYHTLMVSSVSSGIRVASHSLDAFDRPLSDYYYDQARFLGVEGARSG